MSWSKTDDDWLTHPKVRAAGPDGRALWHHVLVWVMKHNTDGHIPIGMAAYLGVSTWDEEYTPARFEQAVKRLVASGMWEEVGDLCPRCTKMNPHTEPGWVMHDFHEYQPSREEVEDRRAKDARKKALASTRHDPLKQAVRARDGDVCRYCSAPVVFGGRGPTRAEFDHIDPHGVNEVDNVVVCCKSCNSKKKDRTLAQAGLVLRPAPTTSDHAARHRGDDDHAERAPADPSGRKRVRGDDQGRRPGRQGGADPVRPEPRAAAPISAVAAARPVRAAARGGDGGPARPAARTAARSTPAAGESTAAARGTDAVRGRADSRPTRRLKTAPTDARPP